LSSMYTIENQTKDIKWLIFRHWTTNSTVQDYDYREKGKRCKMADFQTLENKQYSTEL
jgi:hypothetical protein